MVDFTMIQVSLGMALVWLLVYEFVRFLRP